MFTPLEIKDQRKTDFCFGCVIASIAEQYVGEPCEESYSYAMGKRYSEQPLKKRGVPPKAALMGAVEWGVLPKSKSPYSTATHERDFLADWRNWEDLQQYAVKPFKSFYKAKNIESTLKQTSLVIGLYWQGQWDKNSTMYPVESPHTFEPHEVRGIGFKDELLIIQNSRGEDIGDKGLFYLPKESYNVISHIYYLSPKPWPNILSKLISLYL